MTNSQTPAFLTQAAIEAAADHSVDQAESVGKSPEAAGGGSGSGSARRAPLTEAQIDAGWRDTFSTENPFCPCNRKSFGKAVRWAERAGMKVES